MKKVRRLYSEFKPDHYQLSLQSNRETMTFTGRLEITGRKTGKPSRRITFHQKGLKITSAKIVRKDKKGQHDCSILRINHLPTFSEVRLHTKDLLYPGNYQINLIYRLNSKKAKSFSQRGDDKPRSDLLPSIDEPEAWDNAGFEIK